MKDPYRTLKDLAQTADGLAGVTVSLTFDKIGVRYAMRIPGRWVECEGRATWPEIDILRVNVLELRMTNAHQELMKRLKETDDGIERARASR